MFCKLGCSSLPGLSNIEISSDVMFREVNDGAVLLDLKNGIYYGLDPIGTRVWNLLAENNTVEAICDQLALVTSPL